jgi:hypothetical protein
VGALLAETAVGDESSIPIDDLRLDRFAGYELSREELIEACRTTYSGFYVKKTGP